VTGVASAAIGAAKAMVLMTNPTSLFIYASLAVFMAQFLCQVGCRC
jgi:hypothetical protein